MSHRDEHHPPFDSAGDPDPDTDLILEYLSNSLTEDERREVEQRAERDEAFRSKLSDVVLLKGIVLLALEGNAEPEARDCRRARGLFVDYLEGKTSTRKTAELSRHLEQCLVCEMAFEHLKDERQGSSKAGREGGWGGSPGGTRELGRRVMVGAFIVVALAAGAFGVAGFLSGSSRETRGATAGPGAPAALADGSMLRAGEVLLAKDRLLAADPGLDADQITAIAERILDPSTTPHERADLYDALGKDYGAEIEPLLWALAANDPVEESRIHAYEAIDLRKAGDVPALLAAARREAGARSSRAFALIDGLVGHPGDEVREFFRSLFRAEKDQDEEWRAEVLRQIYGTMKGDALIEARLSRCLADRNDRIRSFAILASADAGNQDVVPLAIELLDSHDAKARMNGVAVLLRHGTEAQFKTLLRRDWSREKELRSQIEAAMRARGFEPPQKL